MIAKYHVEYTIDFEHHQVRSHYTTDNSVACEAFLEELLERKIRINSVKHEGVELTGRQFDQR